MHGLVLGLGMSDMAMSVAGPVGSSTYIRYGGSFRFLRPDGTSTYLRP